MIFENFKILLQSKFFMFKIIFYKILIFYTFGNLLKYSIKQFIINNLKTFLNVNNFVNLYFLVFSTLFIINIFHNFHELYFEKYLYLTESKFYDLQSSKNLPKGKF